MTFYFIFKNLNLNYFSQTFERFDLKKELKIKIQIVIRSFSILILTDYRIL